MDTPAPSQLAGRLASLSPAKRAALESMLLARGAEQAINDRIPRRSPGDAAPLSFSEQRLWLLDRLEPNHPFYNMPIAAQVNGPFDREAFDRSLQQLTDRHETLRYAYTSEAGEPHRTIHDAVAVSPRYVDLTSQSLDGDELLQRMRREARAPFDLSQPPLLRCVVYELDDDRRVILLVMHHIVSDGWSMGVMLSELSTLYEAARQTPCQPSPLLPLPIQYSDFAVWQRRRLDGDPLEEQLAYWRNRLADAPTALELPTDFPRPPVANFDGAVLPFELSEKLSQQLAATATRAESTVFMVLMAAYQAWLSRYTGATDLCVGTAVANRTKAELERLIGFFVNTQAIRVDLSDDPSFDELIRRVRTASLEAQSNQDVPFDRVIEEVAPDRDRSHDALFQTAVVVQNPPLDLSADGDAEIAPLPLDNGTAKYDLTFFFWEFPGHNGTKGWEGQVEYRTSLFKPETIERFLATFQVLLSDALTTPQTPVSQLAVLDESQRLAIESWNQTQQPIDGPLLMHGRVERWMRKTPEAVAVRHAGASLTYAELDRKSAAIAAGLQARGVEADDTVVVCLPRSADSLATMLGVWRAAGVYVPVDRELAPQRLEFIAQDCDAKLVIGVDDAAPPPGARWTTVAELANAGKTQPLPTAGMDPADRAYVIYTSGSTGIPKGVEVEHKSIVNFVTAQIGMMQATAGDRILHAMSPSFDGGLSEALLALASGATAVIADREVTLDPARLTTLLVDEQVAIAKFTPALLATLDSAKLPSLRTVSSAGDKLTGELASRWLKTTQNEPRRFLNGYGPTEATVGVSMYPLPTEPQPGPPPIGAPMANMRAYVLDANQTPVPIGVTGEIYIGGAGVARGYLNRPEETAARFLPDPYAITGANGKTPRMYRTGDLGRWRADGVLEFRGRADDQVQLRGYRVEPGEVTSVLESLPEVDQAYTCVLPDSAGADRLIAYIVPAEEQGAARALDDEHLASWQSLMEQSHRQAGALRDVEFDITGWVSTFTGRPIPAEEMRQWVESTVHRIVALEPNDVLEIGCGSGLILLGVAPDCQSYVGTDFLARSLDQLQTVIDRRDEPWTERVELFQQPAHELGSLAGRKFDTIVMNSVVQYFPSADYLLTVLRQAVGLLKPGGKIFLGDLRNLRLHEAMAAAVEITRADAGLSRRELLGRIEGRLRHEEELLLAPELLDAFHDELPGLSNIEVQLKQGPADNELTRYRFDAVLSFGEKPAVAHLNNEMVIDAADGVTVAETIDAIASQQPEVAMIRGVLNPRVARDVEAWRLLRETDDDKVVEKLRAGVELPATGIEPDAWREAIAKNLSEAEYDVSISWASDAVDRYDVLWRRTRDPGSTLPPTEAVDSQPGRGKHPRQEAGTTVWRTLANRPLEEKRLAKLSPRLREALSERLPQYMMPSAFVLLDSLPRTVQGKIDAKVLPPPTSGRPAWTSGYVEPEDEHQRLVAEVWESLLGVSPIGADDNFFELGGHSMLAVRVMAEIELQSGTAIPLAALFQQPTVRHLASLLANPAAVAAASSLIELTTGGANGAGQAPLFCIHPAGGTVFCYQALASHFANERPVVGVQAVGVDGLRPPQDTMEEMVDHYAQLLKLRWPEGPYHLCGWSLGGNIAYGVAARLAASGHEVGLVGMFDAGATPPEESLSEEDLAPLLAALFPDLDHLPMEELRRLEPDEQVAYFTERATQAGLVDAAQLAASQHVFAVFQKNVQAVHRHKTEHFAGEVTLYRAAEQTKTSELSDDPQLGWGKLAGSVEVHSVATDHAQMMAPPQVDELAALVKRSLAKVENETAQSQA